jgi:5-(hydroxymethyl)furfural/furfural oxidase
MMDHPLAAIAGFLPPEFRMGPADRRHLQLSLRFSSQLAGAPRGDLAVFVGSKSAWHAIGKQIGATLLSIYSPYSQSGEVKLKSRDPSTPPSVTLNLLTDDRDLKRMMAGYRWLAQVYASGPVASCVRNPFPAVWSQRKTSIGGVNWRNRLKAGLAARLLDGPRWVSDRMMKKFVIGDLKLADVLESDETLAQYLKQSVGSAYHVSGSCRMGRVDDPLAVTDEQGLVHGVGGLRIVDASIFPSIPAANTNLPVIMVAERMSDLILKADTAGRCAVVQGLIGAERSRVT